MILQDYKSWDLIKIKTKDLSLAQQLTHGMLYKMIYSPCFLDLFKGDIHLKKAPFISIS